jgi:hypothetical protein
VYQTSPAWVLTFVRWENRDTYRLTDKNFRQVRTPLVVENDCVQINTICKKGVLTPSVNAILRHTDVNYETAIAPGDFVFVNILNWESEARRVAEQARSSKPINGPNDGFKGIFKIQGVRKIIQNDANTGTRSVLFKIDGFGFTEFNNTIYFNPYLLNVGDTKNYLLFMSNLSTTWSNLINDKGYKHVQDILSILIQSFIGIGLDNKGRLNIPKQPVTVANTHFYMPAQIGQLLGLNGVKAAKDIYSCLFGIQKYAGGTSQGLSSGMNPIDLKTNNKFQYTPTPCQGESLLKPEFWNQVKAWSILNQYTNSPLNELYTCFRLSRDNKVLPTIVFRQIPFTNEDFVTKYGNKIPVTLFLTLPRWKVEPSTVLSVDIGRDEAARVNFVQYFGRLGLDERGSGVSIETSKFNYVYDVNDVKRNGLRPYVVSTGFDPSTIKTTDYKSPVWAKILGDSLIGGHLKMNGTLVCKGIVEPIAVGDNLEFDNTVYHIEQITHSAMIYPDSGKKTFQTTVNLSNGIDITSDSTALRYSEMTYSDAYLSRENDFKNNEILPGISEAQDTAKSKSIVDRSPGGGIGFPQPGVAPKTKYTKKSK